jgi:2-haloalkanoic acid dehalogenase type II
MPPWEVLTFDSYGTLVDWEEGIAGAFLARARDGGITLDRRAVLAAYADVEPAVQREAFRPYREVLARSAVEVARRLGWTVGIEDAGFLPASVPGWPVFADTNPALRRMAAAGLELGILSNVDNDLIAATARHFAVPFNFIVTAEDVGAYKPAHEHFLTARRRVGPRRWLHVAQSWFHDVEPATALGIPVAWVNRKAEQPAGLAEPSVVVPDLAALADWLGA